MAVSPITRPTLSLVDFTQMKARTFDALLALDNAPASSTALFGGLPNNATSLFDQYIGAAQSPTSTIPSAQDISKPFSTPGQNVSTVLNRIDVAFKAQFSELSELKSRIAQQQDAAKTLQGIDAQSSNAQILTQMKDFISTYNAGVNRFAPSVAAGGILDGSAEAERARFSLQRDINNPLIGAAAGIRDGLHSLGVSVDPATNLASLDETAFSAALENNKTAEVKTIVDFAQGFAGTTASLNQAGHPQDKQLANLDQAIHWIDDHRAEVAQEFGPGQAATPSPAFSKAAAAYYVLMAKQ